MMEGVVRFTVSFVTCFYDAFTGRVVPPATLTFYCGDRVLVPIVKEDRFAVFTNQHSGDTAIKVTSAFYGDEIITVANNTFTFGGVIYSYLYPSKGYPTRQGAVTLEGTDKKLISISLVGVKKPLWLRLGSYSSEDSTLLVESLLGRNIPAEIGLYLADDQRFHQLKLGSRQQDGRHTVQGDFTPEDMTRGSPVKLYKGEVTPSGEYFLLADKSGGEYIAALKYAKKTVWKTYVENGDKLVLKGGG